MRKDGNRASASIGSKFGRRLFLGVPRGTRDLIPSGARKQRHVLPFARNGTLAKYNLLREHERCRTVFKLYEVHVTVQIIDFAQDLRMLSESGATFPVPDGAK